jgi:CPA2 family monovalent cation:H+ antiporter-2
VTEPSFLDLLFLLAAAVFVVAAFQRLHIPSALGYLLVGVLLGPHTAGPVIDSPHIRVVAEFGIVFLLFTIGLNFSLPQIYALRHLVLGLGTAQVALTTAVVGLAGWLGGLEPAVAFVVGAVFAQSSTTIIGRSLAEQGEGESRHGRLALAMSVFQDVTAVPFLVVIPVLGAAAAASLAGPLAAALAKAVAAFAVVWAAGRWLLPPLFHAIASRRSAELFTLTVLLVSLAAAWTTEALGLSMAFGAFLAGMMLGETAFRHQIESTIRPFRDVLVGLFFVSIGMLFDPAALPAVWHWALGGAAALLAVKAVLVAQLVRFARVDERTAWRTGLVLAVGGEFGFALLAIAVGAQVIGEHLAQAVLAAVLVSMVAGPFLIRYNRVLAPRGGGRGAAIVDDALRASLGAAAHLRDHVIVCGYGRIGQNLGHLLEAERIPYVALDLDPARVRAARAAGEPVLYGDAGERDILEAVGAGGARLVAVTHADDGAALKLLDHVRRMRADLPVMVRTRDESPVAALRAAGATEIVPETLETGMTIALHALLALDLPAPRIAARLEALRAGRYRLLRELFRGDDALPGDAEAAGDDRLYTVTVPAGANGVGRTLGELDLGGVAVTALVRAGERRLTPGLDTSLEAGDVLVLFGPPAALARAESRLLERAGDRSRTEEQR